MGRKCETNWPYTHMWQLKIKSIAISAADRPLISERSLSHISVPCPENRFRELETLRHLAVQISRDSICPGELEGCYKSRCLVKGPAHRLTLSQALTLSSVGCTVACELPEMYRESLSCVVSGQRPEGQPP